MTLGEKLRKARIQRGLTQKQLAGDMMTRNMLSKIENGAANPSVRTLSYLAEQLDLPVGELMYNGRAVPDRLHRAREALREGDSLGCLRLLEESGEDGDEALLLSAMANAAAADEALRAGAYNSARKRAAAALEQNRLGMYSGEGIGRRMLVVLAACSAGDSSRLEHKLGELVTSEQELTREYEESLLNERDGRKK